MAALPLLSILVFTPIIGALFLLFFVNGDEKAAQEKARNIALVSSGLAFVVSIFILLQFNPQTAAYQFTETYAWVPQFNINYALGVDGISLTMLLLTTLLTPICILASHHITTRVKEYMVAFLLMEGIVQIGRASCRERVSSPV